MIYRSKVATGHYSNGGVGYQPIVLVKMYDLDGQLMIGQRAFKGGLPPLTADTTGEHVGDPPTPMIEAWLAGLPRLASGQPASTADPPVRAHLTYGHEETLDVSALDAALRSTVEHARPNLEWIPERQPGGVDVDVIVSAPQNGDCVAKVLGGDLVTTRGPDCLKGLAPLLAPQLVAHINAAAVQRSRCRDRLDRF
jgi:hypothetical protein